MMFDYRTLQSAKVANIAAMALNKYFDVPEGYISLGIGEPDFATPARAAAGAIAAINAGHTNYPPTPGIPMLREELSRYLHKQYQLQYDADEILLTVGGSEAFDNTIRAYVAPGDEVLIVQPCFTCYESLVQLAGGTVVPIPTYFEEGFRLNPQRVKEAITPKTKMLIISFPSNPTGADMSEEEYAQLAEILRPTNILVLTDEIYSELSYRDRHHSILHQPGMRERTFYISGFSKAYAMTGWRLGYVCCPRELLPPIAKVHQFAVMCAPGPAQYAALSGLRHCDQEVEEMMAEYNRRRQYIVGRIRQMGLPCLDPEGAFYIFPSIRETGMDSQTFCDWLMETAKVAVVPGTAFGACGEGFVRLCYAYDMAALSEAMDRMEACIKPLLQQRQAI